jgi:divalent metal cation (Fe/Co/Zn/Cd) transporter
LAAADDRPGRERRKEAADGGVMSGGFDRPSMQFQPLRPAPPASVIAAFTLVWFVAAVVAAWAFGQSPAIVLGLLVAGVSLLVSFVVLVLLWASRRRQEERYAHHR